MLTDREAVSPTPGSRLHLTAESRSVMPAPDWNLEAGRESGLRYIDRDTTSNGPRFSRHPATLLRWRGLRSWTESFGGGALRYLVAILRALRRSAPTSRR
jgi:hypothetical protein